MDEYREAHRLAGDLFTMLTTAFRMRLTPRNACQGNATLPVATMYLGCRHGA
jgi:hypothetical protein